MFGFAWWCSATPGQASGAGAAAAIATFCLNLALNISAGKPAKQWVTGSIVFTCLLFGTLTLSQLGVASWSAVFPAGAAGGCFRLAKCAARRCRLPAAELPLMQRCKRVGGTRLGSRLQLCLHCPKHSCCLFLWCTAVMVSASSTHKRSVYWAKGAVLTPLSYCILSPIAYASGTLPMGMLMAFVVLMMVPMGAHMRDSA